MKQWERANPADVDLYLNSPEVHAAVHTVAHIAGRYTLSGDRDELLQELVRFFGAYDRARTDQVEALKARVLELMKSA